MMKMTVFRDENGQVINIGPWNYMEMPVVDEENGELTWVQHNPLPETATSQDEDVIIADDGGLYVVDDPRSESH